MNIRDFLDSMYAMFVDGAMRAGASLPEALESFQKWVFRPSAETLVFTSSDEEVAEAEPVTDDRQTVRDNNAAMAAFEAMMAGVGPL